MSGRPLLLGAAAIAGGAGYYLYRAGGDPKVAEKTFEKDAASASSSIKSRLPGTGKEVEKQAQLTGEKIGSAFDNAMASTKDATHKVDAKLESYRTDTSKKLDEYRKETGDKLNKAVDKFDHSVEKGAAQSKSWISGWFGGK